MSMDMALLCQACGCFDKRDPNGRLRRHKCILQVPFSIPVNGRILKKSIDQSQQDSRRKGGAATYVF